LSWLVVDGDEETCTPAGAIRAFPHLLRDAVVSDSTELALSASPAWQLAALGGARTLIVEGRYWLWFMTADVALARELKAALIACLPEEAGQ
jgi:hypothetical protein